MSTKRKKLNDAPGGAGGAGSPAPAPETKANKLPRAAKRAPAKRIRIGDALREQGMDERAVAARLINIHESLRTGTGDVGTREKLQIDLLEKFTRQLDPPRAIDRDDGDAGAPIIVQLVHNVPRPQRS
jgi:hypothetical protein